MNHSLDFADVIGTFAPCDHWTDLEKLNKQGITYTGDGWYVNHRGTWALIVKNRDDYLVYSWKFDPRPDLTRFIEAEVRT